MTPNLPHARLSTARNVLLLGSLALLALAGSATAQLPQAPTLPAIDQAVTTPLGTAQAGAADGKVGACIQSGVSTADLPVPAVPLPVPLPALPQASAAVDACAHAKLQTDLEDPAIGAGAGAHASLMEQFIGWLQHLF